MSDATKLGVMLAALAFAGSCPALGQAGMPRYFQEVGAGNGGFRGELAPSAGFGRALCSLGDMDGDGVPDVAVGAPATLVYEPGELWILFLHPNGTVKTQQRIGVGEGGFRGEILGNDEFAVSLASLGDLDGDGVVDLAVGAAGKGNANGAVWILFLNPNGTVKSQRKVGADEGSVTGTAADGTFFGSSLAYLGDLDGDGAPELAVGYTHDYPNDEGGGVWILSLSPTGAVQRELRIAEGRGGLAAAIGLEDGFGWSIAAIGDLNGNGVDDLAVGSLSDSIWILFLNADGTVDYHQRVGEQAGGFRPDVESTVFGASVAAVGDLDGDGVTELAVGSTATRVGSDREGALWILFMRSNGTVRYHQRVGARAGNLFVDFPDGARFGSAVASLGDLDGDGESEIMVGAASFARDDSESGAAFVVFLDARGG